ncbi:hypothetical protein EV193_102294 [Herbihabitans rhizosphaerae]|uniref:Phosphotransferase family enzyme n=1 Tax=Herbihabitans rhizosphaerae TaxID=1872711 RepID=A0A4Q7L294_9PSEU|nr:aminoglycoside phosphotransferase family protein [Herbihabitans rhizosphaerae]RZS43315.1 hypothetical protein EV193_102294 [Herbihabitans rhizosphaerae]
MPTDFGTLAAFARRATGPCEVVADHSWDHGGAVVLELAGEGGRWFAKAPAKRHHFEQETHAYRHWLFNLDGLAPSLVATDDELAALLVTAVPGRLALDVTDDAVHRQLGALARRLHDGAPPATDAGYLDRVAAGLDRWTAPARALLEPREIDFAHAVMADLRELGPVEVVPTHGDLTLRNAVLDDDGTLRLIDFARTELRVPAHDLARLRTRDLDQGTDLLDAVLDGYGRALTSTEWRLLDGLCAIDALSTVAWSHQVGDRPFEELGRRTLRSLVDGAR